MWQRWLVSFPELQLLDLDVGRGQTELRELRQLNAPTLALLPFDERVLHRILKFMVEHDLHNAAREAIQESERGAISPDVHLLAGSLQLSLGQPAAAAQHLINCYLSQGSVGAATRRMLPSLRFALRVTPCTLMPFYPSEYGAAMLYAVALWHSGQTGEALEVLREMVKRWGMYDEVRLVAGQILIQREQFDRAVKTLSVDAVVEHDAAELARAIYLAYAHYCQEQYRSAARALVGSLHLVKDVNPHLMARARLLMAELYERNDLPLEALRQSAHVLPSYVPIEIAQAMLEREERWITDIQHLSNAEIERLASSDAYQLYIPDAAQPRATYSPLDTSRDPIKRFEPKAQSWRERVKEEQRFNQIKAAVARGEKPKVLTEVTLSGTGRVYRERISKAVNWWPGRREQLLVGGANDRLARTVESGVSQVRFDYCGTREQEPFKLAGERRALGLGMALGIMLGLFLVMVLLRGCVY